MGANRYSVATGNWNASSTWAATPNGTAGVPVPVASDNVFIESPYTVTVTASTAVCTTLSIASGAFLTVGGFAITVSGVTSVSGTLTHNNSTGSKIYAGLVTINSGGTWNNSGNSGIIFRGGITNNGTFTSGTGTCTLNTNSQSFGGASPFLFSGNVAISGAISITNNGDITLTGNLTGSAAGSTWINAANSNLTAGNALLTTGTLTANASGNTVKYSRSNTQTVKPATYYNLTLSGTSLKTTTGVTVTGILSMEGSATLSAVPTYGVGATLQYNTTISRTCGIEWVNPFSATGGVIIANTGVITLNSAEVLNTSVPLLINAGATLNTNAANNYALTFGGNYTNNSGIFAANGSAINFNGTANQSIDGFSTTGLVSMTKTSGTVTLEGDVNGAGLTVNGAGILKLGTGFTHTFSGALNINDGTLNGGSSLLKIAGSVGGTGGSFIANTGTVEWNSSGAQTIALVAYNNLVLSGGNTKTFSGATAIGGYLSIAAGTVANLGTFTSSAETMDLGGEGVADGSWGSSSSAATFTNNTFFAATSGIINIATLTCSTPSAPITAGSSICIGSTATLSANGALPGERYKWYSAATGGILLKTSLDYADNLYTTPVLIANTNYWVSISTATGCESARTIVTAAYPTLSADNQNAAGSDSWIGHVYDGTGFLNYFGHYDETESFDESFGGDYNCFDITSNSNVRSIYSETFSVQYRMNSGKKGLYVVDLGSDDGSRLTVDGVLVCNNWSDQSFSTRSRVLMSLNGTSSLAYDFYESGGGNRVIFQNLNQVLSNILVNNISQVICQGTSGSAISGDAYGTLPAGITLSGTGYQWSYSTSPGGTRTDISSATGAEFVPDATVTPFNIPGTYYIFRSAVLNSANNVLPNPYLATNESNAAILTVNPSFGGTMTGGTSPVCLGTGTGIMTVSGNVGTILRWERQINSAGWSSIGNGGNVNFSEIPYSAGTWEYRVAVQNGSCPVVYSSITSISIDANTVAGWISGSSTPVCTGISTGLLTLNGSTGSVLRWEKRLNSGSWSNISNTLTTYSEIPLSGGVWEYRALVQSGSCPSQYSSSFSITVNPTLSIMLGPNPSVCNGISTALLTYSATTGSPGLYSIDFDAAANAAGIGDVSGWGLTASPVSINVPWNIAPAVYNGILTVATSYPVCSSTGYPITVTVTPSPVATFSFPGSPYCQGASNPSPTFGGGGTSGLFSSTTGLVFVNAATGLVDLASSIAGTYIVTNTIAPTGGCSQVTATSSITITPSVSSPVFSLGATSLRFQGAGTLPYTATAQNNTGITYTLDATSLAALNTISASTGSVTFTSAWLGTSIITATASGCDGPTSSTHAVTTTLAPTYYSYQSGNWNLSSTWTFDPGGTTGPASTIPANTDKVVILPGRTVTLSADVATTSHDITIQPGGILDEATFRFTTSLAALRGGGTLQLASANFPVVANNTFVTTDGGTTEYRTSAAFNLAAAQTIYYHLTINNSSAIARQINNLVINGDLHIIKGVYQINDATATQRQLTIKGNVTVDNTASIIVGTGNTVSGGDTPLTVSDGGTAPFLNYYNSETHRVIVQGDFTNNGTVKFTNQSAPKYDAFSTTGAATVYFQGSSNNQLTCNGTTDFYNMVVDKGNDQTFKLTVYSNAYQNFRLFGANNARSANSTLANPDIKKALWVRNGTLVLQGLTVIPSLTEGTTTSGTNTSHYFIPANGAILIDGTGVIVLSTADDFTEVQSAYGLTGGSNALYGINNGTGSYGGLSVLGKLQMNDGYLSTRESAGLLYWSNASGQLILNGGTFDTKQIGDASPGSNSGLLTYIQSGGSVILRGRMQNSISYLIPGDLITPAINSARADNGIITTAGIGTFHLNTNLANGFLMSGGNISIYDVTGVTASSYALFIGCPVSNINVTGGAVQFFPTAGSGTDKDYLVNSKAPFANLVINRATGSSKVILNSNPLRVLQNLDLQSGVLDANLQDISIGGNFSLALGTTYTCTGTSANRTIFNGAGAQNFEINTVSAIALTRLKIDKPVSTVLTLTGTQSLMNIADSLIIVEGTLNDNGKTINASGNIYNSGIHMGSGKIMLNSDTDEAIDGDGTGEFANLELNKPTNGISAVLLNSNAIINGVLSFSGSATGYKLFNIKSNNLKLSSLATISGASSNRYIQTTGTLGDGGLSKVYSSASPFTFPIGAPSTGHAAANYSPATITINGTPTTYGTITINPVGYEHPATKFKGRSLSYYWRVKSIDFILGSAAVTHNYTYSQADVPAPSGDATETGYVAARFNSAAFSWTKGTVNDVDDVNNIIGEPGSGSFLENCAFIDGDYTAGDDVATDPFAVPTVYYSRANARWNLNTTWSTDPVLKHMGAAAASFPGANDIVVIGNNNTINLTAIANCASLQIQAGSVLDIYTWTGSTFSMVLNHPLGNGKFRLTTPSSALSVFTFPAGDFSDFDVNKGTTEFYTISNNGAYLYILPTKGSFGNLMLSPLGGDNLALPNVSLLTIYGDLTLNGTTEYSATGISWSTNNSFFGNSNLYITVEKTIHVLGNMYVNGGSFTFMDDYFPQHLIVDKDVNVASTQGANIWLMDQSYNITPYCGGGSVNNTFAIGGNLNNNGGSYYGAVFNGVRLFAGTHYIDVTFFGTNNASITGTGNTTFHNVTINKGTSQATTLTFSNGGTITTPVDNWLTLLNGTFRYMRTNPGTDFTISTSTPFTIPGTAGLYIDYPNSLSKNILIANSNSNVNDLFLYGKLTLVNGNVYVGPANGTTNSNNDIEYSSGGMSAIDVRGGNLVVNGQIRRNSSNANGILNYSQSGGTVSVNGQSSFAANAKLEVLNSGSSFTMSGGTLNIVRGGGTTYGDLYLRPQTGNVTGGTINFPGSTGAQVYKIDANIPLNNLTIAGSSGNLTTAKLMVSPLVLNGNFTIGTFSTFDANSINTTFNGNFINNIGTAGYLAGTNLTTFSALNSSTYLGAQSFTGATNFYNLLVSPGASLTANNASSVLGDLTISSGTLILGSNLVQLTGNFVNNGRYTDVNLANTGIQLIGTSRQHLSGNGSFGRLELNNIYGAQIDNNISLEENLALTLGVFDINKYLLSLGLQSNILGSSFNAAKMIRSDGVFSDVGIRKFFPAGPSALFLYPIGTGDKYTPAVLTITANNTVGYVRVNNIGTRHPAVIDPANALNYFWEVQSSGITGMSGSLLFNYLQADVRGSQENSYVAARLLVPGTSWSETNTVDAANNTITFNNTGSNNLGGEYTAGLASAFPPDVPIYTSNKNGNWTDKTIWTQTGGTNYPCPDGGPNGFIVIINHEVTANNNYCLAYRTTINNKLKIVSPYYGHNLGTVDGNGTLYLETGSFPAGVYTSFLDCANNGTVEYGGSGTYTIIADLYTSVPNLLFSGTGSRVLPNKDLTVCNSLRINGATLDNSVNNRKLIILGTMEIASGAFTSGSGSNATVSFAGSTAQLIGGSLGNFTGTNAFYNFEINNTDGLSVNTGGSVEVKGILYLTSGLINTNPAAPWNCGTLTITNAVIGCVIPAGGSSTSFINGPLTKKINQGDDFLFPIGINKSGVGNIAGNKLRISSSRIGTILWTAQYKNPNPTFASFTTPLQGVSSKEYWTVQAPALSKAKINISWDPESDITPLVTQAGLPDMTIATYLSVPGSWGNISSSASGDNYNGVVTTSGFTTSSGSNDFTLASLSPLRPKAKLDPQGAICGNAGIPVSFVFPSSIPLNYVLNYTINGIAQAPVTVSSIPYILPTPSTGIYTLTGFTYNNGTLTGVVDASSVTVNAVPTASNAGPDQSLCGITSTTLNANPGGIFVGTGVWSIRSGNGGTLISPTSRTSQFIGLNGTSYRLRWTISNGTCISWDEVYINFTLLPFAPTAPPAQTLCNGSVISDIQVTPPTGATISWFLAASGGSALSSSLLLVSGDYYAESSGGTGCISLSRTKVTVSIMNYAWTGALSTDWNTAGNWSCGFIPLLTTVVQIPNVANKPILSSGAKGTAQNIIIAAGSSLTITGNTIQISGTISNSGTFTASSGKIEMKGSVAQTIAANVFAGNTIQDLIVNNPAGVTLLGALNVTGFVYAQSGNLASGGNLTLVSTAVQTALIDGSGTGNVTGNVTMQRYLPSGFGYKYFSSPFQSATVGAFSAYVALGAAFPAFYKYDENSVITGWVNYTAAAGALVPMQGYAANFGALSPAKTVSISGVVNNNISTTVTLYNNNKIYTKGFNLQGNPYPSPIDWNSASGWTKTNIDNALYYFNAGTTLQYTGTYSSYINGISSDGIAGRYIPSMQGFFIHVSNGSFPVTASLGMNNLVRVNNFSTAFHKSVDADTRPSIRLLAGFDGESNTGDPVVIYFDETATQSFDKELDALKLMNTDVKFPNIYAILPDTNHLSIAAVPFPDSLSKIPLGLKTEQEGWITFSAAGIENMPSGMQVYFSDHKTGINTDLLKSATYKLKLSASEEENRFSLVFSKHLLPDAGESNSAFVVYYSGRRLVLSFTSSASEDGTLIITNMIGQEILRSKMTGTGIHELDPGAKPGMYVVSFYSANGIYSKKVLITQQ